MGSNRDLLNASGEGQLPEQPSGLGSPSEPDRAEGATPERRDDGRRSAERGDPEPADAQPGPEASPAERAVATTSQCVCGRGWSAENPNRCEGGHQRPKVIGIKEGDGWHADHLLPADPPATGWTEHYRDLLRRHIQRLAGFLDGHRPRLRDLRHVERLCDLVERARGLDERLAQSLPDVGGSLDDLSAVHDDLLETELWRRAGLHPGRLETFVRLVRVPEVVAADPALREATLKALDLELGPIVVAKITAMYPGLVHVEDHEAICRAVQGDPVLQARVEAVLLGADDDGTEGDVDLLVPIEEGDE